MGRLRWAIAWVLLASPAAAQRGWDAQGHVMALARDSVMVTGGAGAGIRLGRGLRVAATAGPGWIAPDQWGGRGEVIVAYHLYPTRPGGAGWYLGGGVAGDLADGRLRGLMLLLLGVELHAWRGGGLFAEVGVGGGVRLAAGYRIIKLAAPR